MCFIEEHKIVQNMHSMLIESMNAVNLHSSIWYKRTRNQHNLHITRLLGVKHTLQLQTVTGIDEVRVANARILFCNFMPILLPMPFRNLRQIIPLLHLIVT